jgi:hypothetical protein
MGSANLINEHSDDGDDAFHALLSSRLTRIKKNFNKSYSMKNRLKYTLRLFISIFYKIGDSNLDTDSLRRTSKERF